MLLLFFINQTTVMITIILLMLVVFFSMGMLYFINEVRLTEQAGAHLANDLAKQLDKAELEIVKLQEQLHKEEEESRDYRNHVRLTVLTRGEGDVTGLLDEIVHGWAARHWGMR